ncbi:MAG: hypothetical protein AAFQ65_14925, partial [Myxococcota bacterium]
HSVSLGVQGISILTDDSRRFSLQIPGVSYGLHLRGTRYGFVGEGAFLVPLRASQDGDGFSVLGEYDNAYGGDIVLAAVRYFAINDDWSWWAGGGGHAQVLSLNSALLRDFEHVALGGAALAGLRQDLDVQWLAGELGWVTRINVTADPIDLARGGNLSVAYAVSLAFALELRYD